jgi:hypothetical protein
MTQHEPIRREPIDDIGDHVDTTTAGASAEPKRWLLIMLVVAIAALVGVFVVSLWGGMSGVVLGKTIVTLAAVFFVAVAVGSILER